MSPGHRWLTVLICVGLIAGYAASGAAGRSATAICSEPGNETFDQRIRRHYRAADAVFSGHVRELTLERATVEILETWKGQLDREITMATGVTDNKDGTFTIHGEVFTFWKNQKYVFFAFGRSTGGRFVDPLLTSSCEPNVALLRAGSTIAVLDGIVGRPPRARTDSNEPVVPFEDIVKCVSADSCRGMKLESLSWFDTVGHRVSVFSADGFTYALGLSGELLRIWITQPGEGRPSRLLTVGAHGRVMRAEMGPIPGEGGPRRMSADESAVWFRAHKVYAAAGAAGYGQARGDEFYPFWQEQAARAWNAIQRQFRP